MATITKKVGKFIKLAGPAPTATGYIPINPNQYFPATFHQSHLFGRDEVLGQLDRAWDNPHCHILELVAFGGVGKTSLVNKWLLGLAEQDYRGATRVYAESFYSQGAREGASLGRYLHRRGFERLGDPDPTIGSPWDKGRRLANLIRRSAPS